MSIDSISTDILSDIKISSDGDKFRITTPTPVVDKSEPERFESLPNRVLHEQFLHDAVKLILNSAVFNATQRESKVLEWHSPEELATLLDISLKANCDSNEKLLSLIQDVISYSVKTGHPYFVNQLFSCVDAFGLVGQWLTDALNPSVYTYEVSPVFILMEEVVLREMRVIVGWPDGKGDGLFAPGGSISNGYGISCARFKYMPDIKVSSFLKCYLSSLFS